MQIKLPTDIEEIRQRYISEIDNLTGLARQKYITSVPGQESTYQNKLLQAKEYLTSPVTGKSYYWLTEEATLFNKSTEEVAQNIIKQALLWEQLGAKIEAIRLKAKDELRQSNTIKDIYEARSEFIEKLNNLLA